MPKIADIKKLFIARPDAKEQLQKALSSTQATLLIVYGRRRVGKTTLLEHTFQHRNLLKFEGLENQPKETQIQHFLDQLSRYTGNPLVARLNFSTWREALGLLAEHVQKGQWTVYLEELQWMASYKEELVSDLKYVWDNVFQKNPELILILCGSSTSFMISKVVYSKSIYNRSQQELHLNPFRLNEARELLGHRRSIYEVMDAYLCLGGIPEYLKRIAPASSLFLGTCEESFRPDGFFLNEYQRIFTSSLGEEKTYAQIIELLSQKKFLTRSEISKALKLSPNGHLTELLKELALCGFIENDHPFHAKHSAKTTLSRYCIADPYLQFYYRFIQPIRKRILSGEFVSNPTAALPRDAFRQWLGYGFERFCRQNHFLIARKLGFSAVQYVYGSFFDRASSTSDSGVQIDLVFERKDRVTTVCEIKYLDAVNLKKTGKEMDLKIEKLRERTPKKTFQRVLVTLSAPENKPEALEYFDAIVTLEDFF